MAALWRIFAQLGYRPFETEGESGSGLGGRRAFTKLDPIDPELVGAARLSAMINAARNHGLDALQGLCLLVAKEEDAPEWFRELIQEPPTLGAQVSPRYGSHLRNLTAWRVIREVAESEVRVTSRYFAVAKTEDTSRSIFSGHDLSCRCPIPPEVNLIDLKELIMVLTAHGVGRRGRPRRYNVIIGDLRHWFHQLRAPVWLQKLFGLRLGTKFYTWASLPMGWSWSPYLAQAAAWAFLAYRTEGEAALLDELSLGPGRELPRWISTPAGGRVTVYYDNFMVLSPCVTELGAWQRRIQDNAARLHVVIKAGSMRTIHEDEATTAGFDMLGLHVKVLRGPRKAQSREEQRPERIPGAYGLELAPCKQTAWRDALAKEPQQASWRTVASWVGRAVFALMCRGTGEMKRLPEAKPLIRLARRIGREHAEAWEDTAAPDIWEEVRAVGGKIFAQPPHVTFFREIAEATRTLERIVVATDSSGHGYGWIIARWSAADQTLHRIEAPGAEAAEAWSMGEAADHIFVKELTAACRGLGSAKRLFPEAPIILVVDNSAAYYVLRCGMAATERGQQILDTAPALRNHDEVLLVVSQDNPADCHSRGSYDDLQVRMQRLAKALEIVREGGCRTSSRAPFQANRVGRRWPRHAEAEDPGHGPV